MTTDDHTPTDDSTEVDRPPRPETPEPNADAFPQEYRDQPVWICWEYTWKPERGEWSKVPIDATTGDPADTTDSDTWTHAGRAMEHYRDPGTTVDGLGIVLGGTDLTGIDLDHCRHGPGDIDQWARDIINTMAGPGYVEVSPSGTGIHILARAEKPAGKCRSGDVEMYDDARYFTVTGDVVAGLDKISEASANALVREVWEEHVAENPNESLDVAVEPDPVDGPESFTDDELVEFARDAENSRKFTRLYDDGDTSGYDSHSEADLALVNLLAFWTGGDEARIARLFRQSALNREKWEQRRDYRERTIAAALRGRTRSDFFTPGDDDPDPSAANSAADTAEADGGAASVAPTGGESEAGEVDAEPESGGPLSWDHVRTAYNDGDVNAKAARDMLVSLLRSRHHWAAMEDTESLYHYDPERGIYEPGGEQLVGALMERHLGPHNTPQEYNLVLHRLKNDNWTQRDAFGGSEAHPQICVKDGVLDLSTTPATLHDHHPDLLFVNRVNAAWGDPTEWDDVGAFDQFMTDVLNSNVQKTTAYELIGHAIHPGYVVEAFGILMGEGRNGKTTLLEATAEFLGRENTSHRALQAFAENQFAMADLYGKMANIDADLPANEIVNTGPIKSLSGGDTVKGERKGEQSFWFRNEATMLFATNDPPEINDDTTAMNRRLVMLNFPNEFSPPSHPGPDAEPRHELFDRILTEDEKSWLLRRAVVAVQRLKRRGKFRNQANVTDAGEQYNKASDSVYSFVKDCVREDASVSTKPSDAFYAYRAYCIDEGLPKKTKKQFEQAVSQRVAYDSNRDAGGTRWDGFGFTSRGEQYTPGGSTSGSGQSGLFK